MRRIFTILIVAGFLSGCATSGQVPEDMGPLRFTGFVESSDGAMKQEIRGFTCPAQIDGLTLSRAEILETDGSDAFCNYNGPDDKILTIYLSDFPRFTFEEYFETSINEVGSAMVQAGLSYDPELSETCERSSLDSLSILQSFSNMKDNTMVVGKDPAAVFIEPNRLSILTISDLGDARYLKFRYSLNGASEGDTTLACDFLRERSVVHQREIAASSGESNEEDDAMWGVIKALGNDKGG